MVSWADLSTYKNILNWQPFMSRVHAKIKKKGKKKPCKSLLKDILAKMENEKECYKYLSLTQKWNL